MNSLSHAADGRGFVQLVDQFADEEHVQGFALGVHGNYISMWRSQYTSSATIEEIIVSAKTPKAWRAVCSLAKFEAPLSPIYAVIYVSIDELAFRRKVQLQDVVGSNHALYVERVTPFVAYADRTKHRPIMGGISVGNADAGNSGTLGGFVADDSGSPHILSCNHVLNDAGWGKDVIQQGQSDGGAAFTHSVARLTHVVPYVPQVGFKYGDPYNVADAAAAEVPKIRVDRQIRLLGKVSNIASRNVLGSGDEVVFVGKASDRQEAEITRFIARIKIKCNNTERWFGDLFEIGPRLPIYVGSLSQGGDSGAWVVLDSIGAEPALCGLLIAGDGKNRTLCCFIENVLANLQDVVNTPPRPANFRVY